MRCVISSWSDTSAISNILDINLLVLKNKHVWIQELFTHFLHLHSHSFLSTEKLKWNGIDQIRVRINLKYMFFIYLLGYFMKERTHDFWNFPSPKHAFPWSVQECRQIFSVEVARFSFLWRHKGSFIIHIYFDIPLSGRDYPHCGSDDWPFFLTLKEGKVNKMRAERTKWEDQYNHWCYRFGGETLYRTILPCRLVLASVHLSSLFPLSH